MCVSFALVLKARIWIVLKCKTILRLIFLVCEELTSFAPLLFY